MLLIFSETWGHTITRLFKTSVSSLLTIHSNEALHDVLVLILILPFIVDERLLAPVKTITDHAVGDTHAVNVCKQIRNLSIHVQNLIHKHRHDNLSRIGK